jgi:hypothetical protein
MTLGYSKLGMATSIIVSILLLCFETGFAEGPTVKLELNPDQTNILVASDSIVLMAKARGKSLTYQWVLQGPGKIEGSGPAVFYHVPKKIGAQTTRALVTLTVKDKNGLEATETVVFTIRSRTNSTVSNPKTKKVNQDPLAAEIPQELQGLITKLKSGNPEKQRSAAIKISRSYKHNPYALEAAKEELLSNYLLGALNPQKADALAWMCNVLGASGKSEFIPVLKTVADGARNKKVKNFAQRNVEKLGGWKYDPKTHSADWD